MKAFVQQTVDDLKYKAQAKREEFNEWLQSERVQKNLVRIKAQYAIAKKRAKVLAADIEKTERYKKFREGAAPHLKKIQQKAAELKKVYEEKQKARQLQAEMKEDTLTDREADQALFDFLSDKRSKERKLRAKTKGKADAMKSIFQCIQEGNIEGVERCLGEDDSPAYDENGFTPLHCAANYNKLEILKLFIEMSHASVDDKDRFACTALHRAAWNGHINIVKYLVVHAEAEFQATNFWGNTPFHYACEYGHFEIAQFLLMKGTDVIFTNDEGKTGYEVICKRMRGKDKLERIEKFRNGLMEHVDLCLVEMEATYGNHPKGSVEATSEQVRLDIVDRIKKQHEEWLRSFDEPEVEADEIGPALIKAAKEGSIKWIDDQLAKPDVRDAATDYRDDDTGRSLLHIAVLHDDEDFLEILQDSTSLEPNDKDDEGRTCLHLAVMRGLVDMADLMIEAVDDDGDGMEDLIAEKDGNGRTAMDLICFEYEEEDKEMVRAELEYLLDPDKAQKEADEDEIIRRFQEQVKLAKFYKASHIKYPKWIMEHKADINAKLTGKWLARKKRQEAEEARRIRDDRRAKEKSERDAFLKDLNGAVTGTKYRLLRGREKLQLRVARRVTRLRKVMKVINADIEAVEFVNQQANGFENAIDPRMEHWLYPTESNRRGARDGAIDLWHENLETSQKAISKVWSEYDERVEKMETAAVETSGNMQLQAKIKAITSQARVRNETRRKEIQDLDNSMVIDRLMIITEREKMEQIRDNQTPRSRRESMRHYKRIKYELDTREKKLLSEKGILSTSGIVEQKRVAKMQFQESNRGALRRLKRKTQLIWRDAKYAYLKHQDNLKDYDKETKEMEEQLGLEKTIVEKNQAPLLWRRAQREKCVEIKEELERRAHYRESFAMRFEDITSHYDQRISLREQAYRAKRIKRTKKYRKVVKTLRKAYFEQGGNDIFEEDRDFDTEKDGSSESSDSSDSSDSGSDGSSGTSDSADSEDDTEDNSSAEEGSGSKARESSLGEDAASKNMEEDSDVEGKNGGGEKENDDDGSSTDSSESGSEQGSSGDAS
jgi:ankyrin repeat protein